MFEQIESYLVSPLPVCLRLFSQVVLQLIRHHVSKRILLHSRPCVQLFHQLTQILPRIGTSLHIQTPIPILHTRAALLGKFIRTILSVPPQSRTSIGLLLD